MEQNRIPYPGEFFPGDQVVVLDGTFAEMTGTVVSPDEAKTIHQTSGRSESVLLPPKGCVWVVLIIYGRDVLIAVLPDQIRRSGEV